MSTRTFMSHTAAQVSAAAQGTPSSWGCTTPDAISLSPRACPALASLAGVAPR